MRFLGWASNSEYSQGINLDGNFIPRRKNEKHFAHFSQIEQFTGNIGGQCHGGFIGLLYTGSSYFPDISTKRQLPIIPSYCNNHHHCHLRHHHHQHNHYLSFKCHHHHRRGWSIVISIQLLFRVFRTQSQLVWSFESQGVSKILRACRNFGKVNG